MRPVEFLSVAVLAILISSLTPNVFAARESVQVTKLVNPVSIDGKWTRPDEWSDTNRISMYLVDGPPSTGYVRFKHDATLLYILVDFISDTTKAIAQTKGDPAEDSLVIGIDRNANDTYIECPPCDAHVILAWKNGKSFPEVIYPTSMDGTISYNATNDPDSKTPHAIYELAIPMGTFEKNPAVRMSVWDAGREVNMHWPKYQGSWSMAYFGDLVFSEVVVPELPLPVLVLLLSLVVTCAFARLGKDVVTRRYD
jgi:hypothetical protein